MTKPLDGLLVVALEQAVAAPLCSGRLADAGARVIKIERPQGDFARHYDYVVHGESANFVWLNKGKESLVLDIKQTGDADLLERILAKADVFIQNLAPGAAQRAGFGSDDLRQRYPRLITCDITGYGEEATLAKMKAYDLLVQAETGLCSLTGGPESPGRVGVSVCDIAAGMNAYQGILEAIIQRGITGKGSGVSVSLFDGMADWMTVPLLFQDYTGNAPKRVGLRHPSIAPYGAFETRDSKQIVISIQNEREWARFADDILGHPEWATHGPFCSAVLRVENRTELDEIVADTFAKFTSDDICEKLLYSQIAFGRLNDVEGLSTHPALRRIRVDSPSGPIDLPAPPVKVAGQNREYGPIPEIGSDSDRIREEFAKNG
ncbi:CoA transferase [Terasakiella brassicae]|uniref:CoA transferase n=1 Tax=Terasakiella brassicae TaxID=1634917 RepID=A0A917CA38_9PROT|nr:CaiB/BaiF CoA-transferase family protein [Terasakiella brassicae]GGF74994.1 CoA transferase [Terasakiella brassicae]